jgi:polyisoprenoid-binding protein YceI
VRVTALACLAAVIATPAAAQRLEPGREVWTVDRAHSLLDFTVRLIGFNRVRGSFTSYEADIAYDENRPERSSVSFVAQVASITTADEERDTHLKTADFFDAARVPAMTFRSTSARRAGDTLYVTGDLTIKDSTRSVVLPVRVINPRAEDPFGNQRVSFAAGITLNRRDFGIPGPPFWGTAISDSVTIEMEMAGRVWNFFALNWGPRARRSMGQLLFNAADSSRLGPALAQVRRFWSEHAQDSTYNFSWWEFTKAAMRLSQRQRPPIPTPWSGWGWCASRGSCRTSARSRSPSIAGTP